MFSLADANAAVARAAGRLAAGDPVVLIDSRDRVTDARLVIAAQFATSDVMAFMVRNTSGLVATPMEGSDLNRLGIPPMVPHAEYGSGRAPYHVSVDASTDVTTGISATDRALTIRRLADPGSVRDDFTRPGHVLPLRVPALPSCDQPTHADASLALVRTVDLRPVSAMCELVNDDGSLCQGAQAFEFADRHGLEIVSVDDIFGADSRARSVRIFAESELSTSEGGFQLITLAANDGSEQLALVVGSRSGGRQTIVSLRADPSPAAGEVSRFLAGSGAQL